MSNKKINKTLVICGCSFMTSSRDTYFKLRGPDWPDDFPMYLSELPKWVQQELINFGYHHSPSFIDMFAQQKNYRPIYLSQPGASNYQIREQIAQAVGLNPDLVIVGATACGRLDMAWPKELVMHMTAYADDQYCLNKSLYYMQSGLSTLEKANIPYVFLPGPLKLGNWSDYNIVWTDQQPWDTTPMNMSVMNHNTADAHETYYKILCGLL